MLWARTVHALRAAVGRERVWPPALGQLQYMNKWQPLRKELTNACRWYAIGDCKVPVIGFFGVSGEFPCSAWSAFLPRSQAVPGLANDTMDGVSELGCPTRADASFLPQPLTNSLVLA